MKGVGTLNEGKSKVLGLNFITSNILFHTFSYSTSDNSSQFFIEKSILHSLARNDQLLIVYKLLEEDTLFHGKRKIH